MTEELWTGLPTSYPAPALRWRHRTGAWAERGGTFTLASAPNPPRRKDRRRAWALVPRAVRAQAAPPQTGWLPPRTRALLTRTIRRRNALDRVLAAARGLDPAAPECARFQGEHYRDALDAQVRASAARAA